MTQLERVPRSFLWASCATLPMYNLRPDIVNLVEGKGSGIFEIQVMLGDGSDTAVMKLCKLLVLVACRSSLQ